MERNGWKQFPREVRICLNVSGDCACTKPYGAWCAKPPSVWTI